MIVGVPFGRDLGVQALGCSCLFGMNPPLHEAAGICLAKHLCVTPNNRFHRRHPGMIWTTQFI